MQIYNALIIVPYRDREKHLNRFIPHMNEYWNRLYKVNPDIVLVEQDDNKPFNRAKLFNAAVSTCMNNAVKYYIFHDIDLLPMYVDYSLPRVPTQLCNSHIQMVNYFGGVTMFPASDFHNVNGFSNNFWGWGGEDNEMYNRTKAICEIEIRRSSFTHLAHTPAGKFNREKWKQSFQPRSTEDGLCACEFETTFTGLVTTEPDCPYLHIKVKL